MERIKAIQRGSASASDADAYRPDLLAEDEPRYLRRQKPVEIRRKKFGAKSMSFYRRVALWGLGSAAVVGAGVAGVRFLLYSPQVLLLHFDQVEVSGNHMVSRESVLQEFVRDSNKSVLSVPLERRRSQLEQLSWVETATVQRILPNRLRVNITERVPIAFLRTGNELVLIDAHGVILNRSLDEEFHFPIVDGFSEDMPRQQREKRMEIYQDFLKAVDVVRAGSAASISEMNLASTRDLRVVMTGLGSVTDTQAVTVHFGNSDFTSKYRLLTEKFATWQADSGRLQSVDLQYAHQVVLNPDGNAGVAVAKK